MLHEILVSTPVTHTTWRTPITGSFVPSIVVDAAMLANMTTISRALIARCDTVPEFVYQPGIFYEALSTLYTAAMAVFFMVRSVFVTGGGSCCWG